MKYVFSLLFLKFQVRLGDGSCLYGKAIGILKELQARNILYALLASTCACYPITGPVCW
jgi:hypothetical protein